MRNLILLVLTLLSIMFFTSCDKLEDFVGKENYETTEKLKYYFEENFVDSLDAIYCSNDRLILYGYKEVPITSDSTREERVIYLGRVENNTLVEEDAIVMVVDSTNFPIRIASKEFNMILSKIDESHFDCAVYTYQTKDSCQTNDWIIYNNISYSISTNNNQNSTKALASGGYSEFGLDDIFKFANIFNSLKNGLKSALENDNIGVLVSNCEILNEFNPNDEISLGIGIILSNNLPGILLNVCGYLAKKMDDFVVEQLGKVRITIDEIKYIDETTYKIEYSINGLNENGLKYSEIGLEVYNAEAWYYLDNIKPENCSGHRFVKLSPGKYVVELYVKSTKYEIVEYRVMHTFNVFDLKVDKYEIEDNPIYKDGAVNYKMNIFLKGNEEYLKDIKQFGYYIKNENYIDYKQVKNLSSIFESTPLTYELSIPREGFSDETIDYTTFEAKPSNDYYIGVYVVLNNGKIVHFDEKLIDDLIYKFSMPSLYISNIILTDSGVDYYDDNRGVIWPYYWFWSYDITLHGGFIVNKIYSYNTKQSGKEVGYPAHLFNVLNESTIVSKTMRILTTSKETPDGLITYTKFYAELSDGTIYKFRQGLKTHGGTLSLIE